MSVRLVLVTLLVLTVPALTQQVRLSQRLDNRVLDVRPEPPRNLELQAARAQAMQHDVAELSALSTTLQDELRQLQKGLLSKDLGQHLKRVEKLSKKVRQEVGQ